MKYKTKKTSIAVYCFIALLVIQSGLMNTDIQISGKLGTAITGIELLMLFFYLAIRKYSKNVIRIILILISISIITYIKTGASAFMMMLIFAIVVERESYKNVFNAVFYFRLFITLIVVSASLVGLLGLYKTEVLKSVSYYSTGYGLGYTHPNRLAYTIIYLLLIYVCIRKEKMNAYNYVGIIVTILALFRITRSRTMLFCTALVIVLLAMIRIKSTRRFTKKILDKIGWLVPIICTIFSLVLPLVMLKSSGKVQLILYKLNGFLGSRLTHVYRAMLTYPITLFGGVSDFADMQDIYGYSTVDNGYIRLLYSFGIMGFLLYLVFTILSIRFLIKKKEYAYVIVIVVFSIWGISENVLESVAFNVVVPFWSEIVKHFGESKKHTQFGPLSRFSTN